jgi:Tfp pilus assembly protein PilX
MDRHHPGATDMMKDVLKDEKGVVLILVLIVLVASIIMGVMIIRSSVLESRMAGNERRYLTRFFDLESAVNLAVVENTTALGAVATTEGLTYDYPTASLPTGTNVRVTLSDIRKPPIGKGYDPTFKARYYTIVGTNDDDNQTITIGAYKVFPPTN